MFFADKPYISDFFKQTIRDNNIPVVGTEIAEKLGLYSGTNIISEKAAVEMARASGDLRIYTTSENAIGWISKHLAFSDLPEKIALFKDKVKFRKLTKSMFPDFYFKEVCVEDLTGLRSKIYPCHSSSSPRWDFSAWVFAKSSAMRTGSAPLIRSSLKWIKIRVCIPKRS